MRVGQDRRGDRYKMTWFAWILIAVFFWSLGPVMAKVGLAKVDPLPALTIRTLSVALILVLVTFVRGAWSDLRTVDPRSAMFLVADGVSGSLLAHLAYFYALSLGEASSVIPISATYPVLAMFLSALVLREHIAPGRLLGVLLIIAGVYLVRRF
jgi:bacterial/archaeal transporter family protein